jgi:hypothetical protein
MKATLLHIYLIKAQQQQNELIKSVSCPKAQRDLEKLLFSLSSAVLAAENLIRSINEKKNANCLTN